MKNKGFTLLEVMISLLIIAVAFVVLLHSRNKTILVGDYSKNITMATLLASQKITEIEHLETVNSGEEEGDFGDRFPNFRWKTEISDTPFNNIKEIRVIVLWGPEDREREVEIIDYLRSKLQ